MILLEQIRTLDKVRLKVKIGTISNKIIENIDKALRVTLNINYAIDATFFKEQEFKDYIFEMTKPLVLTEGKTDTKLIKTAWKKLYPNKDMIFECMPSGIEYYENRRTGGADHVRRSIESWSTISQRPIIGLFDNDREGNEKFKGLNVSIFEKRDEKKDLRNYNNKDVCGMLLPVPNKRKIFVTDDDIT